MLKSFWNRLLKKRNQSNQKSTHASDQLQHGKKLGKAGWVKRQQGQAKSATGNDAAKRRRSPRGKTNKQSCIKDGALAWTLNDFQVAPVEGKTRFHDLNLPDAVMHAIADLGFQYCTPIQAEILPGTLAGRDAAGRAQTGTGKTAAFLITVLTRMLNQPIKIKRQKGTPRILVLAPTRELVMQIADEAKALAKYTQMSIVTVFGGMDYEKQRRQLNQKIVDIVVATPGRLLDFKRQKEVHLKQVETLIIDEADRMLDMGFIPDVRKIVYSTPHKDRRQTLLFSATLTPEVTRLASQWTREPLMVEIEPEQVAVDTVDQIVYIVTHQEKYALLYNIITRLNLNRVIVFCNRKDETRKLADMFNRYNINCAVLSGDVRQKKRVSTLEKFKAGRVRILVATDVAGRGIHIEGMNHVINYSLPRDPEDYVHRIGRTGRAGASGTSISFADEEDSFYIPTIEELMGRQLACTHPEEQWLNLPPTPAGHKRKRRPQQKPNLRRSRGGRSPKRPSGNQRSNRNPRSRKNQRRHSVSHASKQAR